MIGMNPDADYLLDPQMQKPVCMCLKCKREIYRIGIEICEYCMEGEDEKRN